ncbi:calcium-binding protein [Roseivivax isoporae]|uniref:calcium-binding protein n=1 Tax=Roseivivax isoporae TaxID=591206 RepID=UPI0004B04FD8|nr:calcium-binding protein [Roseivivax isoporae]
MSDYPTLLAPVGGETTLLPSIASGSAQDAVVTSSEAGGYIATFDTRVWTSFLDVVPANSQLFAQVFDTDGAVEGETAVLDPQPGHWIRKHLALALKDGGYAVFWAASTNYDASPPVSPPIPEFSIFARSIDAEGAVSEEVEVLFDSRRDAENAWLLDAEILEDGRVAVLWNDVGEEAVYLGLDFAAENQTVSIYDPNFSSVLQTISLEDPAERLTALRDGGFQINWTDGESYRRLYGTDGTALGAAELVPTLPIPEQGTRFSVTELDNGNQLALWSERVTGLQDEVRAQVYTSDGTALGETIEVNTPAPGEDRPLNAVALDGGGFTVAWQDWQTDRYGAVVVVQSFGASGERVGPAYSISGTDGSNRGTLTHLSDGEAVLRYGTYQSGSTMSGEQVLNSNFLTHLDLFNFLQGTPENNRLTATEQSDILTGGDGDDVLVSFGGDDFLNGGIGADTVNGGEGNDTLIGGLSPDDERDVIYAGAGNDSVEAGHGNDLVFGQDGNDTIAGGFGVDQLQGQNGNDVITGSAFSDLVFGGAGDDFVNGGFGFDRINGGTGADRFFHAGAEGHGSDWIQDYNAAEGDVLLFGDSSASVSDFVLRTNHTASPDGERAGDDEVQEAFVNYRGQTFWALVDGDGQSSINLQIGGEVFDLLA